MSLASLRATNLARLAADLNNQGVFWVPLVDFRSKLAGDGGPVGGAKPADVFYIGNVRGQLEVLFRHRVAADIQVRAPKLLRHVKHAVDGRACHRQRPHDQLQANNVS